MKLNEADLLELRAERYQRKAFPRTSLSVVTAWVDKKGDLRLTVGDSGATIPSEATAGEGAGPEKPG